MDVVLILFWSTRGSTREAAPSTPSPFIPIADRDMTVYIWDLFMSFWLVSVSAASTRWGNTDVGRGPFAHAHSALQSRARIRLDRQQVEGRFVLERSVAYCAVIAGRWGLFRGGGSNCRPRPLLAGRWSVSPAPGNTPRRSWPKIGSGAALSHRCEGSGPRLGRSVECNWPSRWLNGW